MAKRLNKNLVVGLTLTGMVPGHPDPDNVRDKMKVLADKLGVKLAQAGDAAQTQPAH